ncbi:MAG: peptidoglycan DD-metalloendopeptidase family protein [Candidatus Hydrogenedentes bacterium]|nr:peptidoglycan DD-metalloendopeptidase family protein [Candidatus Hydrogenedentota bacterium]
MSIIPTLALLGASLLCGSAPGTYAWPLALEPQLTSSFCEYRPGRFHAGIDLRTNGVGRDVFAAGDGYISRVRCSPYGYGKAVYLQLNDGNSAVYAHLSGFYPELEEFVRREQHGRKSYTVDIHLQAGQFPIRKGQLIAKSGQTGIGAPHLHFEMRDTSGDPVNPRLLGFDWPDSTPPRIDKVLVAAKGLDGRVNGDIVPMVLDATRDESGRLRTTPIYVEGLIGVGADVTDPGAGGYNLGVHRLRLLAGDTEVFRVQHDRMSYGNHRNGAVSYHPYMRDQGRFLVLWRWPGNTFSSYQHSRGDGWLAVTPDLRELTVEATDFHENATTVTIPIVPGAPPSLPAERYVGSIDVWGPELIVSQQLPPGASGAPRLHTGGGPDLPFAPFGDGLFRAAFQPSASGRYTLNAVHDALPDAPREVAAFVQGQRRTTVTMGDVELSARPNSGYGVLFLRAWKHAAPPAHPLPARSDAYQIWPTGAPIFDAVQVSIPLSEGARYAPNVHVYRHRGASWSREDTTHRNGRLEFEMTSPGIFMAMEDAARPNFANVTPPEGYAAQTRRPEIRANVSDTGSGIAGFSITCGGQWLLSAYDPERDLLYWEQDADLPPGPLELVFTLTDAAGNTARYTRNITVP